MTRIVLASLAVAVSGLAFGVANADSRGAGPMAGAGGPGERPSFAELDTDGDGSITMAEVTARGAARFTEGDADGDGKLSAEELTAAIVARAAERAAAGVARMIEQRDTDGDGALSQAEMGGESGQRMFSRMDADDDGKISAEEFAVIEKRGHLGQFGGKGGHQGGERRGDRG